MDLSKLRLVIAELSPLFASAIYINMIMDSIELAQMTIMEVWGLMIRNFCLMAILLLTFSVSISLVPASVSSSMMRAA